MSASDSSRLLSLILPNGLRVVLCSAPRLKRCAAAIRVAAGSHDVPEQWPGLAHFLEHLFFLGTERFPTGEHLMSYVQRHGGQLNASTRERTTDFFFELSPPEFAGGLERLCEMLTHPRLSMDDQLREREVLHAEFIAWSRDDASRNLLKRLQPLSASHPLRWFHAGNRFSLPVPRQAFQQALQDFYRRFYHAGQITLSLSGPQTLDELQALATRFGGCFPTGVRVEQQSPPALMGQCAATSLPGADQRRTHLVFACEGLPQGHERAADFLCTWMNNGQSGGLVACLREAGLIESLKATVLYAFAGQTVIEIEIAPTTDIACKLTPTEETRSPVGVSLPAMTPDQTTHLPSLIFDWLSFFKTHYQALLEEYARLQTRHLDVASALSLARHYSADDKATGMHDEDILALEALLNQLTPDRLIEPLSIGSRPTVHWRLPKPNPFLHTSSVPTSPTPPSPAWIFNDHLAATGEASVYLRWTLSSPQPTLFRMLNESLKTLIADAGQAGVTLGFSSYGNHWQLKLGGMAEPIPAVLAQTLHVLAAPTTQTQARYGQPESEPALIPIRQLLKTLPDHYLNNSISNETRDAQAIWRYARWTGFAAGLQATQRSALTHAIRHAPGTPDTHPLNVSAQMTDSRWAVEPSESSEDAVLMFYPTPTASIEDEVLWRLFAHIIQGPFYQRLRVELQLGYAVFSGFRQIAGQSGLLFGVQSPSTNAMQLVEHMGEVLKTLPALIERADLQTTRQALGNQLALTTQEFQVAAETLWQAHLAGHAADYPQRLQHSLANLSLDTMREAASRIALPQTPVLYLANRAVPDGLRLVRP